MFKYSGSDVAKEVANFSSVTPYGIKVVNSNKPNELGIFNMSGNVWEWCSDFYASDYSKLAGIDNPKGFLPQGRALLSGEGPSTVQLGN